jgi:hypothetical protein
LRDDLAAIVEGIGDLRLAGTRARTKPYCDALALSGDAAVSACDRSFDPHSNATISTYPW